MNKKRTAYMTFF